MSRRNLFWGERFENPNEESIWDELRYWYQNPITEAEQKTRDKEIQDYIDVILEKAFGG